MLLSFESLGTGYVHSGTDMLGLLKLILLLLFSLFSSSDVRPFASQLLQTDPYVKHPLVDLYQ